MVRVPQGEKITIKSFNAFFSLFINMSIISWQASYFVSLDFSNMLDPSYSFAESLSSSSVLNASFSRAFPKHDSHQTLFSLSRPILSKGTCPLPPSCLLQDFSHIKFVFLLVFVMIFLCMCAFVFVCYSFSLLFPLSFRDLACSLCAHHAYSVVSFARQMYLGW